MGVKYFLSDAGRELKKYNMTPSRRNLVSWFSADSVTGLNDGDTVTSIPNLADNPNIPSLDGEATWSRYSKPNCKFLLTQKNYGALFDKSTYNRETQNSVYHQNFNNINVGSSEIFPDVWGNIRTKGFDGNPKLELAGRHENGDDFTKDSLIAYFDMRSPSPKAATIRLGDATKTLRIVDLNSDVDLGDGYFENETKWREIASIPFGVTEEIEDVHGMMWIPPSYDAHAHLAILSSKSKDGDGAWVHLVNLSDYSVSTVQISTVNGTPKHMCLTNVLIDEQYIAHLVVSIPTTDSLITVRLSDNFVSQIVIGDGTEGPTQIITMIDGSIAAFMAGTGNVVKYVNVASATATNTVTVAASTSFQFPMSTYSGKIIVRGDAAVSVVESDKETVTTFSIPGTNLNGNFQAYGLYAAPDDDHLSNEYSPFFIYNNDEEHGICVFDNLDSSLSVSYKAFPQDKVPVKFLGGTRLSIAGNSKRLGVFLLASSKTIQELEDATTIGIVDLFTGQILREIENVLPSTGCIINFPDNKMRGQYYDEDSAFMWGRDGIPNDINDVKFHLMCNNGSDVYVLRTIWLGKEWLNDFEIYSRYSSLIYDAGTSLTYTGNDELDISQDFCMEGWFTFLDKDGDGKLKAAPLFSVCGEQGFIVASDSDGGLRFYHDAGQGNGTSGTWETVVPGVFSLDTDSYTPDETTARYHVAVIHDAATTTVKIFVNGALTLTTQLPQAFLSSVPLDERNNNVYVGCAPYPVAAQILSANSGKLNRKNSVYAAMNHANACHRGRIGDCRLVIGEKVYVENNESITVPTTALSAYGFGGAGLPMLTKLIVNNSIGGAMMTTAIDDTEDYLENYSIYVVQRVDPRTNEPNSSSTPIQRGARFSYPFGLVTYSKYYYFGADPDLQQKVEVPFKTFGLGTGEYETDRKYHIYNSEINLNTGLNSNRGGNILYGNTFIYSFANSGNIARKNSVDYVNGLGTSGSMFYTEQYNEDPIAQYGYPGKLQISFNPYDGGLTGSIMEVLIYTEKHNDAKRRQIEDYLALKYGIVKPTMPQLQKWDAAYTSLLHSEDLTLQASSDTMDEWSTIHNKGVDINKHEYAFKTLENTVIHGDASPVWLLSMPDDAVGDWTVTTHVMDKPAATVPRYNISGPWGSTTAVAYDNKMILNHTGPNTIGVGNGGIGVPVGTSILELTENISGTKIYFKCILKAAETKIQEGALPPAVNAVVADPITWLADGSDYTSRAYTFKTTALFTGQFNDGLSESVNHTTETYFVNYDGTQYQSFENACNTSKEGTFNSNGPIKLPILNEQQHILSGSYLPTIAGRYSSGDAGRAVLLLPSVYDENGNYVHHRTPVVCQINTPGHMLTEDLNSLPEIEPDCFTGDPALHQYYGSAEDVYFAPSPANLNQMLLRASGDKLVFGAYYRSINTENPDIDPYGDGSNWYYYGSWHYAIYQLEQSGNTVTKLYDEADVSISRDSVYSRKLLIDGNNILLFSPSNNGEIKMIDSDDVVSTVITGLFTDPGNIRLQSFVKHSDGSFLILHQNTNVGYIQLTRISNEFEIETMNLHEAIGVDENDIGWWAGGGGYNGYPNGGYLWGSKIIQYNNKSFVVYVNRTDKHVHAYKLLTTDALDAGTDYDLHANAPWPVAVSNSETQPYTGDDNWNPYYWYDEGYRGWFSERFGGNVVIVNRLNDGSFKNMTDYGPAVNNGLERGDVLVTFFNVDDPSSAVVKSIDLHESIRTRGQWIRGGNIETWKIGVDDGKLYVFCKEIGLRINPSTFDASNTFNYTGNSVTYNNTAHIVHPTCQIRQYYKPNSIFEGAMPPVVW